MVVVVAMVVLSGVGLPFFLPPTASSSSSSSLANKLAAGAAQVGRGMGRQHVTDPGGRGGGCHSGSHAW